MIFDCWSIYRFFSVSKQTKLLWKLQNIEQKFVIINSYFLNYTSLLWNYLPFENIKSFMEKLEAIIIYTFLSAKCGSKHCFYGFKRCLMQVASFLGSYKKAFRLFVQRAKKKSIPYMFNYNYIPPILDIFMNFIF